MTAMERIMIINWNWPAEKLAYSLIDQVQSNLWPTDPCPDLPQACTVEGHSDWILGVHIDSYTQADACWEACYQWSQKKSNATLLVLVPLAQCQAHFLSKRPLHQLRIRGYGEADSLWAQHLLAKEQHLSKSAIASGHAVRLPTLSQPVFDQVWAAYWFDRLIHHIRYTLYQYAVPGPGACQMPVWVRYLLQLCSRLPAPASRSLTLPQILADLPALVAFRPPDAPLLTLLSKMYRGEAYSFETTVNAIGQWLMPDPNAQPE